MKRSSAKRVFSLTAFLIASFCGTSQLYAADMDGIVGDYGSSSCPELYQNNTAPIVNSTLSDNTLEHCHPNNVPEYEGKWVFSDLISSVTNGPLYAAEILTASNIEASRGVSRKGITFFNDPSVPMDYQGNVSDYTRSGYDRGHMANWADSADPQTFELTNIVPQDANNNRQLWEKIETVTRKVATKDGLVYVISGPIYDSHPEKLNGASNILVPSYLFKCLDSSSFHGCYVVKNGPGWDYIKVSYNRITQVAGVNPFPGDPNHADDVYLPNPKDGRKNIEAVATLGTYHAGATGSSDQSVGTYEAKEEGRDSHVEKDTKYGLTSAALMKFGLRAMKHYHARW